MNEIFIETKDNPILALVILASISVIILIEIWYYRYLGKKYLGQESKNKLKQRLEAYADLKRDGAIVPDSEIGARHAISAEAHEILLGTLKKVEQKSATLTTVIVFALTISLGSILAGGDYTYTDAVLTVICLALFFPFINAFRGIRQVDQKDFLRNNFENNSSAADHLQDELMSDLLEKERAFQFASVGTRINVVVLVLVMSAMAILGVLAGHFGLQPIDFLAKPNEAVQ